MALTNAFAISADVAVAAEALHYIIQLSNYVLQSTSLRAFLKQSEASLKAPCAVSSLVERNPCSAEGDIHVKRKCQAAA